MVREAVDRPVSELLRKTWAVSSDSHVVEPPNLWQDRVPGPLRDRAPRVVTEPDGDWWYIDGLRTLSFVGMQAGDRFVKDSTELLTSAAFEQVRPAAYDPALYLAENEVDGIWGSVLYPSEGLSIFKPRSTEVVNASAKAYNDWLAEFCNTNPSRLKGIAIIHLDDVKEACDELARCRAIGLSGALITVAPPPPQSYRHPDYDRFWAVAQDLDMPLSLHIGTERPDPTVTSVSPDTRRQVSESYFATMDYRVRQAFADLIFSGVFERFPRLQVGTVEHELGWIPFFLEQMDYTYKYRPVRGPWHRFIPGVLPSDFFHQNAFASFQEDTVGIRERSLIGVSCLLWGSDYPHTESTFPRSLEILTRLLANVPPDETVSIVCSNAARRYHFDVPSERP